MKKLSFLGGIVFLALQTLLAQKPTFTFGPSVQRIGGVPYAPVSSERGGPGNNYGKVYNENPNGGAPNTELGKSQAVDIANIDTSSNLLLTSFLFGSPVNVQDSFFAALEMSTTAGDTVAVVTTSDTTNTPGDGDASGMLAWDKFSDGTWHAFMETGNWLLEIDMMFFPVMGTNDTLVPPSFADTSSTFNLYTAQGGGYVAGTNGYGDLEKAQKFGISGSGTVKEILIWFGAKAEHSHAGISSSLMNDQLISVSPVFPNPSSSVITIPYSVKSSADVRFTIYNMLGQEVKSIVKENAVRGSHTIYINIEDLTNGLYTVEANGFGQSIYRTVVIAH